MQSASRSLRPVHRRAAAFEGEYNNIVSASVRSETTGEHSSSKRSGSGADALDALVVAVDVDEVLGRFLESLNEYVMCASEFGQRQFRVDDYFVYEFAKVWGCSASESNRIVHEFFDSRHFRDGIAPIPGALESLRRIKQMSVSLNVVTSRQHVIQEPTLDWLAAHYGGIFDAVHFGNHFSLEGASRKKSELCEAINAGILVDDNVSYALECAEAGIEVLLFDWNGSYPWSQQASAEAPETHPLITRVCDWGEVEAIVKQRVHEYSQTAIGASRPQS
jgi:uncharacterized HAD superfamily protein